MVDLCSCYRWLDMSGSYALGCLYSTREQESDVYGRTGERQKARLSDEQRSYYIRLVIHDLDDEEMFRLTKPLAFECAM